MRAKIIGLTGPTGAGKSTVCAYLKEKGAVIVDCDRLAREAVEIPECLLNLAEAFGEDVVQEGKLQRRELAKRAFQSDEKTALLNSITHPVIIALAEKELLKAKQLGKIAVIDAPVLFEAGMEKICDCTVAVWAPFEERIRRIMKRDGLSEEEAKLRMARQHDKQYYKEKADVLLNGTAADIQTEIERVLKELQVMI